MRTKKAMLNYLTETLPQLIILILGFFKTKVFLICLGSETLGIFQVFSQLLYYLSLLDGGAGTIIGYYLYKPIKENDTKCIGSILSATINFFAIVAGAILILGSILDLNIMYFIKDATTSKSLIQLMFLLILVANVLSYFYTPYTLFFDAKQERYKYNMILQPIFIVRSVLEIVLVYYLKSLFVVLIMQLIICIIQNVVVRIIYKKNYNMINLKANPDYSFLKKIKDIIPHKIGSIVANNIDIVIVSSFINVSMVVVYTSYYYITEVLQKFIDYISSAVIPGLGNLIISDEKKAYDIFKEYNEFLYYIGTIICIPLFFSISDFVRIWYGPNLVTTKITVFMFVALLFYKIIRNALGSFVNARGLFKETIFCTFLEAVINLTLSLLLVKKFQILGILIGTMIAYIVSEYCIKPSILNIKLFHQEKNFNYYKWSFKYITVCVLVFTIFFYVSEKYIIPTFVPQNLLSWFLYSLVIFIINFVIISGLYKLLFECRFFYRVKSILGEKLNHAKN